MRRLRSGDAIPVGEWSWALSWVPLLVSVMRMDADGGLRWFVWRWAEPGWLEEGGQGPFVIGWHEQPGRSMESCERIAREEVRRTLAWRRR